MSNSNQEDLFISLISDIKTYKGSDPLLPWLRGIRKLKDTLSSQLLGEKLPRFLQKCAHTFESDRRYGNDVRYLRVWLHLMDFVDDPKALLSTMEEKRIGMKRSLFYQAYALYYEKLKKFQKADMMYHRGVQNLAEPLDDLKKSYEQFLQRMEHKQKKQQPHQRTAGKGILRVTSVPTKFDNTRRKNDKTCETHSKQDIVKDQVSKDSKNKCNKFRGDDTVYRFVDTAVIGSKEEDACHHGLVEPTINTKEALNAINSMFREPLDPALVNKRSNKSQLKPKLNNKVDQGFEVFIDENMNDTGLSDQSGEKDNERSHEEEPFQIYVDVEDDEVIERKSKDDLERNNTYVFPIPKDTTECSLEYDAGRSSQARPREDTVVRRFVGATISEEPKVENVCHHGLVEPTINLKEAMDDINSMFGKPIDFVRTTRRKRQEKELNSKNQSNAFVILPDVELDHQRGNSKPRPTARTASGLFEPTVCTKEAMDDINKLFAMPLD